MKRKNWTYHYDKDTDSLFVGEFPMKKDARKCGINEDINLYVDKKGELRGIFIEYFKMDLQKRLKELSKRFN